MSARFIPSPASTSEASLDDMSRRQLMLYVSLVIKCDKLVAPGQNWGLKILHRAGCPPQWQNHIVGIRAAGGKLLISCNEFFAESAPE
ncbi:hypothetical protein FOZ63_000414 [Perkinsus olseni]|uniref:Uncharacterized protein n=1 Tax=Perkinsus olseni TaxID=32597 RepID=A0A7J6UB88_PEROL|nr:hypothetical protein FOZ60_015110 [Perkinsus olseni]KAF4744143.1 hypothetical protein FOZ62_003750 [Perkinsus olseni]KAF4754464.1 hypothetical protein FOZ63_000414 [Perkinsus olseni]